jgi:hypothetical protein
MIDKTVPPKAVDEIALTFEMQILCRPRGCSEIEFAACPQTPRRVRSKILPFSNGRNESPVLAIYFRAYHPRVVVTRVDNGRK